MSDLRPSILAIDDTPANLLTLGAALASEFKLRIATSGAMGLALADQAPPDLILLDVMMPGIDGYETCRRLKAEQKLKNVPVIFLTALGDVTSETAGLALGAADYITKPIHVAIARQRILNLIEREQLRKRAELHRDYLETLVDERTATLSEQTNQLDAIFSLSPDGFVSFAQDSRVKHVNNAFTRMTGLAGDRLIGLDSEAFMMTLLDLCVASPRPLEANDWFHGLSSGNAGDADRLRLELSVPAGRMLEVRRRQNPGNSLSQVLYFHDISQLMEVDRMKSEFLSLAAHELRTPMVSIYGFSEILLDRSLDDETRHEVAATIHRQAQAMSSIIDDLVDLAGIEARQGRDFAIEHISLADAVSDALLAWVCPADRMRPRVDFPNETLRVRADRKRIAEATAHLLANAYAYSSADSAVSIGFRIRQERDGRMLGIAVQDCGQGMSPEQRQRCCQRFYRADLSGRTPGTGLGLSIVNEIIAIHGGEIDIDSALGQGTTVILWLPEARSAAPGN